MARITPNSLIEAIEGSHEFSLGEIERCLELPFGTLKAWKKKKTLPKTSMALLRVVHAFPWVINVAANRFSEASANYYAGTAMLEIMKKKAGVT